MFYITTQCRNVLDPKLSAHDCITYTVYILNLAQSKVGLVQKLKNE